MTARVRILIVDDSATSRRVLRLGLEPDPALEIVGECSNAKEALRWLERNEADAVTMDVLMEEVDGIAATKQIKERWGLPVVLVTGADAANLAFDAMRAGAIDVVRKPKLQVEGVDPELERLRRLLRLAGSHRLRPSLDAISPPKNDTVATPVRARSTEDAAIIVIGASCGGPPALATLLAGLKNCPPAVIAIAQHIGDGFVPHLAQWLSREAGMEVEVVRKLVPTRAGRVYLAPGDADLCFTADLMLQAIPHLQENRPTPSIDRLLESAATHAGGRKLVAVLLTGMGTDGVLGLTAIQRAGGKTIVQDESTSAVFGMPKEAIGRGLADVVASLQQIASIIGDEIE